MESKIYTLHSEEWSAEICPEMGANLISLRHNGYPILREPDSFDALLHSPVLYGVPILFPPNRTSGGKFTFDGKDYSLPINETAHNNHLHGFIHSAPFEVLDISKNLLRTGLVNRGEYFPFPFQLTITDQLNADGLLRSITVENSGNHAMPLVLAFHTTFTQPKDFCVPIGKCWAVNEHHIPTGELLPLTPDQIAFRQGCAPSGQRINGFFEAAGNTARIGDYLYQVSGFDQWIFFNGDGKQNYLCVEPQLGPVNALNSGGYRRLEPGEACQFTLKITHI